MKDDQLYNQGSPQVKAIFFLKNKDTVTIDGVSVMHVFFELQRRFPDGLKFEYVGFSGETQEDRLKNVKKFYTLAKRYGA